MTGDRKPWVFASTPAVETYGQFSHDVHWIAYEQTNPSGRPEVVVKPFPGPGPPVQVSSAGGRQPRWDSRAQELFSIAGDGVLTSVEWRTNGGRFEVGAVRPLFETPRWLGRWQSDIHVDGQRFLMGFQNREDLAPPLTLVTNWPALLGK